MNLYECLGVLHLLLFPPFLVGDQRFMRLEVSLWRFLNKQPGWKASGKWEMRSDFLFFLIVISWMRHQFRTTVLWTDSGHTRNLAFDLLSNRNWFSLTTVNGVIAVIHQSAIRVDLQLDVEGSTDNICSRSRIVPVLPLSFLTQCHLLFCVHNKSSLTPGGHGATPTFSSFRATTSAEVKLERLRLEVRCDVSELRKWNL